MSVPTEPPRTRSARRPVNSPRRCRPILVPAGPGTLQSRASSGTCVHKVRPCSQHSAQRREPLARLMRGRDRDRASRTPNPSRAPQPEREPTRRKCRLGCPRPRAPQHQVRQAADRADRRRGHTDAGDARGTVEHFCVSHVPTLLTSATPRRALGLSGRWSRCCRARPIGWLSRPPQRLSCGRRLVSGVKASSRPRCRIALEAARSRFPRSLPSARRFRAAVGSPCLRQRGSSR